MGEMVGMEDGMNDDEGEVIGLFSCLLKQSAGKALLALS